YNFFHIYSPHFFIFTGVEGIEPPSTDLESTILPLDHTPIISNLCLPTYSFLVYVHIEIISLLFMILRVQFFLYVPPHYSDLRKHFTCFVHHLHRPVCVAFILLVVLPSLI